MDLMTSVGQEHGPPIAAADDPCRDRALAPLVGALTTPRSPKRSQSGRSLDRAKRSSPLVRFPRIGGSRRHARDARGTRRAASAAHTAELRLSGRSAGDPRDDRRLPLRVAEERASGSPRTVRRKSSFSLLREGTIDVLAFSADSRAAAVRRLDLGGLGTSGDDGRRDPDDGLLKAAVPLGRLRLTWPWTRSERPGACNVLQAPFLGISAVGYRCGRTGVNR